MVAGAATGAERATAETIGNPTGIGTSAIYESLKSATEVAMLLVNCLPASNQKQGRTNYT